MAKQFDDAMAAYDRRDYTMAFRLLRPLAELGHARAQAKLAFMYHIGRGVAEDQAASVSWDRKAANQGNADAQFSLGVAYSRGEGVPQDRAAAVPWYRKAANQGHADAQSDLGVLYARGLGVPQDYVQAHMWLSLASAQGKGLTLKYRDDIAASMTPVQIAEAQRLAREWKPKPAR